MCVCLFMFFPNISYLNGIFPSDFLNIKYDYVECPSSESVKPMNSDVYIVNLSLCSDVKVIKECSTIPEQPQSLNLQRVSHLTTTFIQKNVSAIIINYFSTMAAEYTSSECSRTKKAAGIGAQGWS